MINVFIADDHGVIRDGLRALLESHENLTVVGDAPDGREAVRAVRKLRPQVVIMDISMQELNGIEATEQICQTCPDTKVIMLSIYATPEYVYRALHAGAKGYLLKESAGREVISAVLAVANGRRYLSQKISEAVLDDYISHRSGKDVQNPVDRLSKREREILQLIAEGKSNGEIARKLFLSQKTVETYRYRLMQKLGINDVPGLVKFALQHGLATLE